MNHIRIASLLAAVLAIGAAAVTVFGTIPAAAASSGMTCQAAGTTGLTAAVIATSGQKIAGSINATGCDIGVYAGPGVNDVTITNATVTGANDHGIFLQDSYHDVIESSLVTGNGLQPHACPAAPAKPTGPCIAEDKAIELVGTQYTLVQNNVVDGNLADGGIGLADDGNIDPGALQPGTTHISYHNVVADNVVTQNKGGCGIVAASYNPGAGVSNNVIENNLVSYNPAGIIIAADVPQTTAVSNDVFGNVAENNFLPGIIVHSNSPGDLVNFTRVEGNVLVANGGDPHAAGGQGPSGTTGIVVIAEPMPSGTPAALLEHTSVVGNVFTQEATNLFTFGATGTQTK